MAKAIMSSISVKPPTRGCSIALGAGVFIVEGLSA